MPNLTFAGSDPAGPTTQGVTLVVYAPFGTDAQLSTHPDGSTAEVSAHPLVQSLKAVAAAGTNVCALIDRVDDDTWLLEIRAGSQRAVTASRWKQDMDSPRTLAGLLARAAERYKATALVLALEGHGAGYLPELDISKLNVERVTDAGRIVWHIDGEKGAPLLPKGSPLLPKGSPLLPKGSPLLPVNHYPISTWGLRWAIDHGLGSGPRRLGVIHFNNCFNMSVELLHTVSPCADFAAGYMNYNFFTAGASYPKAFAKLQQEGIASTGQLARWFAEANRDTLAAVEHHPTVGGVVQLSRMPAIGAAIDALAKALIGALAVPAADERARVVDAIRGAIAGAQQYDTIAGRQLETPDELTDIASLATQLREIDVHPDVRPAAAALLGALSNIKVYGERDSPWTDPEVQWDFRRRDLAMNILCPDPLLGGWWDWRSPYYLQKTAQPDGVQPHVIDFLSDTAWVDFIVEYHREVPFLGLRPAAIPEYPVYRAKYP